MVSTHPATRERIERLEAKWKKLPKQAGYRKFDLDYGEFKKSLTEKVEARK